MKKIVLIIFVQFLIFTVAFSGNRDGHLLTQFKKFVEINERNEKAGNTSDNNYIFVYTPGVDYNFSSPPTTDWLFEAPEGTFANPGSDLSIHYHDLLNNYNTKVMHETNGDMIYQHYVIVINLVKPLRSEFTGEGNSVGEATNNIVSENPTLNDHEWYGQKHEDVVNDLRLNSNWSDIFLSGGEYSRYVSVATISPSYSASDTEMEFNTNLNLTKLKVETNLQVTGLYWEVEVDFKSRLDTDFKDKLKEFPGQGLIEVAQRIKAFIATFNQVDPGGATCEELYLSLITTEARTWMQTFCSQMPDNLDANTYLLESGQFLDYYYYLNQNHGCENDMSNIESFITGKINEYINTNSTDHKVFLLGKWGQETEKDKYYKRYYYLNFFDIEQPSVEEIKDDLTCRIECLDKNFGRLNFLAGGGPPNGPFFILSGKPFLAEISWQGLNNQILNLTSGAYTSQNKAEVLNDFKAIENIESIIWNKFFYGIGGGSLLIDGVSSGDFAHNLSTWIVQASESMPEQSGFTYDASNNTYSTNNNCVVWSISDKYEYLSPQEGNTSADHVKSRNINYDDLTNIDIKINYCIKFGNLFTVGEEEEEYLSCAYDKVINYESRSFFDLVYLIDIQNPTFLEDCGGGSNECYHKVYPVPAFWLAKQKKDGNISAALTAFGSVLTIASIVYTGGIVTGGGSALLRIIAGIWLANDVVSLWLLNDSPENVKNKLKSVMGEENIDDKFETVQTINTIIGLSQLGLVNYKPNGSLYLALRPAEYKKAFAFAKELDACIKATGKEANTAFKFTDFKPIVANAEKQVLAKQGVGLLDEVIELQYAYFKPNIRPFAQASDNFADLVRRIQISEKLPNAQSILDGWQSSELARLMQVVDNNPSLIGVFADPVENAALTITARLDAFRTMYNAGSALDEVGEAITKLAFPVHKKGMTLPQMNVIAQLDDIKAIDIAYNLANKTGQNAPSVNQFDLVASNAKSLEGVRPNIMDEISLLSGSDNLLNPNGIHSWLDDASKNPGVNGWKYELDHVIPRLDAGNDLSFSKKVQMKTGPNKEVDELNESLSELVELKHFGSGGFLSIGDKLSLTSNLEGLGYQIGKIHDDVLNQYSSKVGKARITGSAHDDWRLAPDSGALANKIKDYINVKPDKLEHFNNMDKLIIENDIGTFTILKSQWNN